MKKNRIFNIMLLLSVLLLAGCKKEEQVDVSNINNSINSLIQNLPQEDSSSIETSTNLKEPSSLEPTYEIDEIESTVIKEEELLKLKESMLRTSEDVLPAFEDFSFSLPSVNLPENVTYLKNDWLVHGSSYVSSSISLNTPSVYLYTAYPYDESLGTSKLDYDERFKTLIQDSLKKFGNYISGENFNISSISEITADNRLVMIFDCSDCYVVEIFSDTSTSDNKGSVDVYLYFISKDNPHDAEGEENLILKYIKSMVKNYRLNIYYRTNEGNYVVEHGKNSDYNNYIISKYLGE